jgi:23S rRNA (pseudouridine1915-N3)-methyltransferase
VKIHVWFPHPLRTPPIRNLVDHYLRLATRYLAIELHEQPYRNRKGQIPAGLLDRLSASRNILLTEHGLTVPSTWFRDLLAATDNTRPLHFLVGDAFGFPDELARRATDRISLTPLTLPHELALLLLVEQLWRGIAMARNHPYHK